jgi:hypothetical protein
MSTFRFGSHLPVLIKLVNMTTGPILEYGGGMYSSVFLHWACHAKSRMLVTLENRWEYYKKIRNLRCDYHDIQFVKEWSNDICLGKWSIVLIDHGPGYRRENDAKKYLDSEYVVLHDSNEESYGYKNVFPLFKYRFDYIKAFPNTSVLSNIHDLKDFTI